MTMSVNMNEDDASVDKEDEEDGEDEEDDERK